ncbi:hypothetical protein LWI28_001610 [Acer negundo]|uniref:Uncharacterized protein n=1 Tax=Acer negundo TaxID=4023 RepID=A0AAD5J7U4_ACENE|nr:hypothetical protein LWI28_001610 [Acer negundo]
MDNKTLLFLFLFSLYAPISYSDPNPPSVAHAQLTNYGFPIGLLPSSVQAYNLNQTSGHFSVHLGDSCKLTLPPDNYVATYSRKITGKIDQGRIADLQGIRLEWSPLSFQLKISMRAPRVRARDHRLDSGILSVA